MGARVAVRARWTVSVWETQGLSGFDPFMLESAGGDMYPAPEIGYADDLISLMG